MKNALFALLFLLLVFKPSIITKLVKNTFLLIVLSLVVIGCCMTSCVTSFSSSILPRTHVNVQGNRANVSTPYGTVSTKLPSFPVYSQPKNIYGSYCKWLSKDVVRCLQIVPEEKADGYNVYLIQKTNTVDTLNKEFHLSLQKIDGTYLLIRDKTILVNIKEGKATLNNETFKRTDK